MSAGGVLVGLLAQVLRGFPCGERPGPSSLLGVDLKQSFGSENLDVPVARESAVNGFAKLALIQFELLPDAMLHGLRRSW